MFCTASYKRSHVSAATSTGSEVFFILTYIDDTKFVFLSLFLIIETVQIFGQKYR